MHPKAQFYNTGYINTYPHIRRQQDKIPLGVANACILKEPTEYPDYLNYTKTDDLHPVANPKVYYGSGTPASTCPCLRWIQPP